MFPTVDGRVVAGPTALDQLDKDDWSVRPAAIEEVVSKAARLGPDVLGQGAGGTARHRVEEVRLLESLGYYDFKISVKSSHVPTMIRAYRMLADRVDYPLHSGVTEAGTVVSGAGKVAGCLGTLLSGGVGAPGGV